MDREVLFSSHSRSSLEESESISFLGQLILRHNNSPAFLLNSLPEERSFEFYSLLSSEVPFDRALSTLSSPRPLFSLSLSHLFVRLLRPLFFFFFAISIPLIPIPSSMPETLEEIGSMKEEMKSKRDEKQRGRGEGMRVGDIHRRGTGRLTNSVIVFFFAISSSSYSLVFLPLSPSLLPLSPFLLIDRIRVIFVVFLNPRKEFINEMLLFFLPVLFSISSPIYKVMFFPHSVETRITFPK